MANTLEHLSFSALAHSDQIAVRHLFDNIYQSGSKLTLNTLELFRQRQHIPVSLNFYNKKLERINNATFRYLNKSQRKLLHQELIFTFYLLSCQYQLTGLNLDGSDSQRHKMRELGDQIKQCADLIKELRRAGKPQTPETMLATAIDDSEKHLRYLGLTTIAPLIVEGALMEIRADAAFLNSIRGQWSRTRGIFSNILGQLSDDFINKQQIKRKDSIPSVVTGYISWILYYTYFGIDLFLLLKHTLCGQWMNQEERDLPISTRERFQTQWEQRKFSLLGNLNWAIGFMVCFYWFTGNGTAGYLGNVLTIGFLLVDVGLAAWRFSEERNQHIKDMRRHDQDINTITMMLNATENMVEKEILQLQLDSLLEAQRQCKFDWKYKKKLLRADLAYAASLVITFNLIYCFLLPSAIIPSTIVIGMAFAGSLLYFIQNLTYNIVSNNLDIIKSNETRSLIHTELQRLLSEFTLLKRDTARDTNGFLKKKLYLDMKQLLSDSTYQKRLAHFQILKLVRAVLINTLAPSLLFMVYMFAPISLSLAVLAAVLGLATASQKLLKKPATDKLPALNEEKYNAFLAQETPTVDDLKNEDKLIQTSSKYLFFSKITAPTQPAHSNFESSKQMAFLT